MDAHKDLRILNALNELNHSTAINSSARGEQFLNLRRDPPILGLDCAFKYGYRASSPVEEILVKIPARRRIERKANG